MARPRIPVTAEQLAGADRRLKMGVSEASVAKDLGVSRNVLRRRLAEGAPGNHEVPDPVDDLDRAAARAAKDMGLDSADPVEQRSRLVATIEAEQRIIATLEAAGELAEVRKHRQVLLTAENVLRAVQKQHNPDAVVFTRDQLREAEKTALAKIAAYAEARPNLCAHCSRELSIRWAEGRE